MSTKLRKTQETSLIAKVRELERLEGEMESGVDAVRPLYEVDWAAIHALTQAAPIHIVIPPVQARARYKHIEAWRERVRQGYPDKPEDWKLDDEWLSYLMIYRDGDSAPIPDHCNAPFPAERVELWRWIDPMLLFMNFVNAEVAAVYRVEDIQHTRACRVWCRFNHVLADVPEKDAVEIRLEGCVMVRPASPEEME